MIDVPTLFILGAGASAPYGYPTGAELRKRIVQSFTSKIQPLIWNDAELSQPEKEQQFREARRFVEAFEKSSIVSIDKFLSLNPQYERYGKIAITWAILDAEKSSGLREHMGDISRGDWYTLLFNRMVSLCNTPEDCRLFGANQIAFITFNYDRSLDYFLYESFLNTFYQSRQKVETLRSPDEQFAYLKGAIPFSMIHVYGQVDKIQWLGGSNYKGDITLSRLQRLSKNIRIIGQRTGEYQEEIRQCFANAKRAFFLGFGYAAENLESILFFKLMHRELHIYGTALEMTNQEVSIVKGKFVQKMAEMKLPHMEPSIRNCNCYDLLREFL